MNIKLLQKIKKAILKEPRRLEMESWASKVERGEFSNPKHYPPCGTAACIAGHAVWLENPKAFKAAIIGKKEKEIDQRAQRLLQITQGQSARLFYVTWWPYDLSDQYREANTPLKRARIAVKRIDRFIESDGTE